MKTVSTYRQLPAWISGLMAILALAHGAFWAWGIQALRLNDFAQLGQAQAQITSIRYTNDDPSRPARRYWRLQLKLKPLGNARMPDQELMPSAPGHELRSYSERHVPGDIVDVWLDKPSGRMVSVFPPERPDPMPLVAIVAVVVALLTWLMGLGVYAAASEAVPRKTSKRKKRNF